MTYGFLMIHHLYTFELTLRLKRSPAPYPKPLAPSYFETNGSLLWAAFSGFFPSSAGIGTTPWCLLTFRVNLYCETSLRITTTHSSSPVDQGVLRAGTQPALFFFYIPTNARDMLGALSMTAKWKNRA